MVCYGLSQNTQVHQLTSYRDVIMGKPYNEICDNLEVKLIYEEYSLYIKDRMVWKDGKMDIPEKYSPYRKYLELNQMVLDCEIIQTFAEQCNISKVDIKREVSINIEQKDGILHSISINCF